MPKPLHRDVFEPAPIALFTSGRFHEHHAVGTSTRPRRQLGTAIVHFQRTSQLLYFRAAYFSLSKALVADFFAASCQVQSFCQLSLKLFSAAPSPCVLGREPAHHHPSPAEPIAPAEPLKLRGAWKLLGLRKQAPMSANSKSTKWQLKSLRNRDCPVGSTLLNTSRSLMPAILCKNRLVLAT